MMVSSSCGISQGDVISYSTGMHALRASGESFHNFPIKLPTLTNLAFLAVPIPNLYREALRVSSVAHYC
jgi:hypothetical protein